jgi:PTS system sorbose-specific iic component
MPEAALLPLLALVGGVVALDATAVGQLMLSRPLAAATLGGAVAGAPAEGLVVGVFLEALHLAVLPVGAAKYPEGGPAAVAAGAAAAGALPGDAEILLIVLFALVWETVSGLTVERMRHLNVRFAGIPPEGATPAAVARRHLGAVAIDFARGTALTLAAVLLLGWLLDAAALERVPAGWARAALELSLVAGAASGLRLFGRGRWPFFVSGAALALLVLFLRGEGA